MKQENDGDGNPLAKPLPMESATDTQGEHVADAGGAAVAFVDADALKQNTALLLAAAVLAAGGSLTVRATDILRTADHEFSVRADPAMAGVTIIARPKLGKPPEMETPQ